MKKIIISEYGYIGCDERKGKEKFIHHTSLSKKEFKELYDFWLNNKETQKVFEFESKECLKATNYVGVIQTLSLSIEILPKIYNGVDETKIRTIFIEMLKTIYGLNELQINKAHLSDTKQDIFEIFITLFVEEMNKLIHKGLKNDYILQENNQNFLKGKLKFSEHLKRNFIHKERFFVEYDDYLQDRVENRLLKSTINLLLKKTKNHQNKKHLRQQLFIFDNVRFSNDYKNDISKINIYRAKHYHLPLELAKLFLQKFSFTSMSGDNNVYALLFPMEKVFENYLEIVLNNSKDILNIDKIIPNGGKNEYLIQSDKCKIANLQPDYLIIKNKQNIIADAKWKLLKKCEISSNDVYQMFAYLHFYNTDIAYLLTPKIENSETKEFEYINSNNKIIIVPLDLEEMITKNHHKLFFNFIKEKYE